MFLLHAIRLCRERAIPFPAFEGGSGWGDERFVLHKPCLHPDSVAHRPPLEKGGQGGYPRVTTAWCAVPGRLSSAELSYRPNVLAMPFDSPCRPFSRGDAPITRNKNTRLESPFELGKPQLFITPPTGHRRFSHDPVAVGAALGTESCHLIPEAAGGPGRSKGSHSSFGEAHREGLLTASIGRIPSAR